MNNSFALFDWDNTVRKGFTLFTWIDYLCDNNIISNDLRSEMNYIKTMYKKKRITHDQYAELACSLFAKKLAGTPTSALTQAIEKYIIQDKAFLINNISSIFDILFKKNIDVIILSGAPELILQQYQEDFHIKQIYAFKEDEISGVYSGKVSYNYGFDKQRTVNMLCKKYEANPLIAFGDSESDVPMLDKARHSFCVGKALSMPNLKYINQSGISADILDYIWRI